MRTTCLFVISLILSSGFWLGTNAHAASTIVLDPGHGGQDHGGIRGQKIKEKTMALDVALRAKPLLERQGYKVVMTRSTDVFIPLKERANIANRHKNSMLVSIHFDAYRRSGAHGISTFYMGKHGNYLSRSIHRELLASLGPTMNRGSKQRSLSVLKNSRVPATLLELGYLTNPKEGRKFLDPNYRQKAAEAIVRGINSYNVAYTSDRPRNAMDDSDETMVAQAEETPKPKRQTSFK